MTVGIEPGAPRDPVDVVVQQLGIPFSAVIVEESPPIVPYALLVDRQRPVQGGLQASAPTRECTLGFNALRGTTSRFVIASHCSPNPGGIGTPIRQPLISDFVDNRIGVEIADPPYAAFGCPPGRICRSSDGAYVAYDDASFSGENKLARTSGPNGSITVDISNPSFTIVSETAMPVLGVRVSKIGRSTGWTEGRVTGTCRNVDVTGTNLTYICQHGVTSVTSPGPHRIRDCGDSGAPVFEVVAGGVSLHGILCCGTPGGTEYYFSSMSSIEAELGELTTFSFPPPPPPPGLQCPEGQRCCPSENADGTCTGQCWPENMVCP